MKRTTKAHLAVLTANFIFGSNYAVVKYVTPTYMHSFAVNVVRVLVSLFLFWILFLFKSGETTIKKAHLPRFLLCGLTGVAINQLFFIKGVSLTTAIHSSLLSLATPIFITLIALWLLKERFSVWKLTGLASGICGALLLLLTKRTDHTGADELTGDLFILVNAISYAFYLVLVRPLMLSYSPVQVLRWVFTFGGLIIVPFGWHEFIATDWQAFHITQWLSLTYIAVGATFLAYLFNVYGVAVIGASATGAYIYTQPVFAAVIAMVFAGESITAVKLVAAVLIFAGVYFVNFEKTRSLLRTRETK